MGNLIYENIDRTFSYAYNGSGNISKITDKTGSTAKESTFVYDEANQLIRENNAYTNKTVTYTYDAGGNILTKTEYPFTTGSLDNAVGTVVNYTYGNTNWKDLLTEFNGNAITYDQIGNPLSYYNGTTFTWERGRKLATATTADGTAISYKYNDSGIRTQKTVNGVATDYFLDGSKIVAEKTGNNTTWYYYDGDGTREAIEYKGNVYYYFYNAQGDVMGLYDNNLNVVVEYTYDSWGNVVSITGSLADTLGQDNPFRYRGYYFDTDTGLYYLNSRYYDSNTGRFINVDGFVQTGQGVLDKNMFAYCMNNPIIFCDPSGCQPEYYTVIIPAEGGGPATVPPGYTYTSTKGSDGIYTYTVTPITKTSSKGVEFIASYEGGCYTTPYDDGYGNLTIGYGHLIKSNESFTKLTELEAMELLAKDLNVAERMVLDYSNSLGIAWDQNEFDALVSLAFNSGNNVKYVIDSINSGMNPYDAFSKVIKVKGKPTLGLYRRRMDEADMFTKGTYERTYRNW